MSEGPSSWRTPWIHLRWNFLCDGAAGVLSEILHRNPGLQTLGLRLDGNRFTHLGLTRIVRALPQHLSQAHIDVRGNWGVTCLDYVPQLPEGVNIRL